jgi:ATP-dependent RNA helicase DDX1
MVINFGDAPFKFGPPEGFVGLAKAPADVTVSAAAAATAATAGNSSERKPLCLVLEPSRDLAEQTHKCFQAYGKHLNAPALSSVLLVGGMDAGAQFKALKEGKFIFPHFLPIFFIFVVLSSCNIQLLKEGAQVLPALLTLTACARQ